MRMIRSLSFVVAAAMAALTPTMALANVSGRQGAQGSNPAAAVSNAQNAVQQRCDPYGGVQSSQVTEIRDNGALGNQSYTAIVDYVCNQ